MRVEGGGIDRQGLSSDRFEKRDWLRIPPTQRQNPIQYNELYITFTRIAHRGGSESLGTRRCCATSEPTGQCAGARVRLLSMSARISAASCSKLAIAGELCLVGQSATLSVGSSSPAKNLSVCAIKIRDGTCSLEDSPSSSSSVSSSSPSSTSAWRSR